MRRIVLSLAVLSATALGACSGGGSVLNFDNSSKPDRVIVTVVGPSNVARVLPGASLPLSAVAVRGSQNGFVNGNNFRWSAALITSGTYTANELGQTKACQAITVTSGGTTTPLATDLDFGPYAVITIDPTNEGNVLFTPPAVFPPPFAGSTVTPHYPYCVVVSASSGHITGSGSSTTFVPDGAVGSITVAVVDPAFPLN
jgi:hypothetical protein